MTLTEYQLWRRALTRLKATCEQDGTPFCITTDDVLKLPHPTKCPLTDIQLQRSQGHWSAHTPTLLMFNPVDGYIKGNIMIASNLAATMMHTLTADQQAVLGNTLAPHEPYTAELLDEVSTEVFATADAELCEDIFDQIEAKYTARIKALRKKTG